jgi:TRAP-type C4-dicarboxylate transport system permease small subunit
MRVAAFIFKEDRTVDGKTKLRVISKLVLLLVVIGFFMPVSCNLNGFELASIRQMETLFKVLLYTIFISALIGVVIGIALVKQTNIDIKYDWLLLGAGFLSLLLLLTGYKQEGIHVIQIGGYMIEFGLFFSLKYLIHYTFYDSPENKPAEDSPPAAITKMNRFDTIEEFFLMGCTAAIVTIIGLSIFSRYIMNVALTWADEASRFIFIWAVFIGAAYGVRKKIHGSMKTVFNRLGTHAQWGVMIVVRVVSLVAFTYVFFLSFPMLSRLNNVRSPNLEIPMSVVYAAVPVSCLIIVFRLVLDALRAIKTKGGSI